jgi:RRXRR protein
MAVFVLDPHKQPLMPCSEKRARLLLARKQAVVHRLMPFIIRLKDRKREESRVQPVVLKLDPGCTTTGMALVREKQTPDGPVHHALHLAELAHRGEPVHRAMLQRARYRRRRRSANLRYRKPRCAPRHAAIYPPKIGEELEGRFLGHSPYLELKSEGNRSMVRTRGTSRDVADEWNSQDPHRMAKARLLELQS